MLINTIDYKEFLSEVKEISKAWGYCLRLGYIERLGCLVCLARGFAWDLNTFLSDSTYDWKAGSS